MPGLWHYVRRAPSKARKLFFARRAEKLHVGCGTSRLEGWTNVDNQRLPGVDAVIDVAFGLPFRDVRFVFAEHFIEHLRYEDARYFLGECRRVLRDDGVLRLSTPDLDWVWASHYRRDLPAGEDVEACFRLNRAFRAWGHQFLYNFAALEATLHAAGFADVVRCEYGRSSHPELAGLETHPRDADFEGLPDVIVVEAWGRGSHASPRFAGARDQYLTDLNVR